jgi:DNA-binding NarL/FixJ family response regulator
MMLRVLIVDDHDGFRARAAALLELEGFDVVGGARSAEDAEPLIDGLRPDILLLDIQLPGADGFDLAQRLRAKYDGDGPAVVLISSRDAAAYGPRIGASGALGFLGKDDLSGQRLMEIVAPS